MEIQMYRAVAVTHPEFPWVTLIISSTVLALELVYFLVARKSFVVSSVTELTKVIIHLGEEVMSDESGKKLCGMLVFMLPLGGVVLLFYGINRAFVGESPVRDILLSTACLIFIFFSTIGCYVLNRRFIARG
jgi:hypothetical protein